MHASVFLAVGGLVSLAAAAPIMNAAELAKRDEGIYTYYCFEHCDEEEKREAAPEPEALVVSATEKRDEGIYSYYCFENCDEEEKREAALEAVAVPEPAEKRDEGIYTYYCFEHCDEEEKREAQPQDFEDEVVRSV